MKKILLIIGTVVALIIATYFADRATRLSTKSTTDVVKADNPGTGEAAPELTLKDLDGKNVSLSDYKIGRAHV